MARRRYSISVVTLLLTLIVLLSSFFVISLIGDGLLTGLAILNSDPPRISYIPPTPSNGSIINAPWVVINSSSVESISIALLSWGSRNVTMNSSSDGAWVQVNGSGVISFVVVGLGSNDSLLHSDERSIILGYVNWTSLSDQLTYEDTSINVDLNSPLSSVKPKSEIGLAIGQNRPDIISCGISATRSLNCSTMPDAFGSTQVTVVGDDGSVSSSLVFNVNVTPVNDPPRLIAPIPAVVMTNNRFEYLRLASYFSDPESDPISFLVNGSCSIPSSFPSDGVLSFTPNFSSIGACNISIIANDSMNATFSNRFALTVNQNSPPRVISRITSLVLNGSRAYRLRFTQLFADSDEDPLTYDFQNLSYAKLLREGNSLYIVPYVNSSGSERLVVNASDGMYQATFSIPINILYSSPVMDPFLATRVIAQSDPSAAKQPAAPSAQAAVTASPAFEVGPGVAAAGIPDQFIAPGEEVYRDDAVNSPQSDLPSSYSGPILKKPLPQVIFDENQTSFTLDMREYFDDPSGRGLDFLVEPKKGLTSQVHSKSIVVISLSAPDSKVGNDSVRIIARDTLGNIGTGALVVSVNDKMSKREALIDLVLQSLIALMVVVIIVIVYLRHFHESAGSGGASDWPVVSDLRDGSNSLISDLASGWISFLSPQRSINEPPELKREALLIKEGISAIKAIASSADDSLIQAALAKEQEKLHKALSLMRGKPELSRQEFKHLTLYIKEVSASLVQIVDMSEEYLIYQELRRVAARMYRLSRDLEVKLSYMGERQRFDG